MSKRPKTKTNAAELSQERISKAAQAAYEKVKLSIDDDIKEMPDFSDVSSTITYFSEIEKKWNAAITRMKNDYLFNSVKLEPNYVKDIKEKIIAKARV